eukprot:860637-Rhodomonas_salina.2
MLCQYRKDNRFRLCQYRSAHSERIGRYGIGLRQYRAWHSRCVGREGAVRNQNDLAAEEKEDRCSAVEDEGRSLRPTSVPDMA